MAKRKILKKIIEEKENLQTAICKIFKGEDIRDCYGKYLENSVYIVPPNSLWHTNI